MKKTKKAIALLLSTALMISSAATTAVPAFAAENGEIVVAGPSIKIEAENFTDQLGVQKADVVGNPGVGYIHTGDYIEYSGIKVPSDGKYLFTYVYTAWPSTAPPAGSAPTFRVEIDGEDAVGTIAPALANTGTLLMGSVELPLSKGTHTLKIVPTATGNMNFDWFSFTQMRDEPSVWIQGEDHSTKIFTVGSEDCQDVGGGRNVSSIDADDWMEYDVTVPTSGVYDIEYRVAALSKPGKISLITSDGVTQTVKATTEFAATGAWQNWISVFDTVRLDAGTYKMRIHTSTGAWNLNWFKLYLHEDGVPQQEKVLSPVLRFENPDNQSTYGKVYKDALYNISVINTVGNPPFFQAGSGYQLNAWTRDGSLNSWNAGSLIERDVALNTLKKLVKTDSDYGTIIDQGSSQWWDMIIWSTAAWNQYLVTGDTEFLALAYDATANTLEKMQNEHFNSTYGLFKGPSFFNDGIAGYPAPYNDNTGSSFVLDHEGTSELMCLSTNCLYYSAYQVAAAMAKELDKDQDVADGFSQKADHLKQQINDLLWIPESNRYAYFMHGDGAGELAGTLEDYQEGAGLAFAILFGVADDAKAEAILENAHIQPRGLPSIWPIFAEFSEDKPGRHNNLIWPQINALYAKSAAYTGSMEVFANEFDNITTLFRTNKDLNNIQEIYNSVTGKSDGGYQTGSKWGSCDNQAWSATGYLSMVYEGMFGMRFSPDGIAFAPYLRSDWGDVSLSGIPYRDMTLDVNLTGTGSTIRTFKLDGIEQDAAFIPADLTGSHTIDIEMADSAEPISRSLTVNFPARLARLEAEGDTGLANITGVHKTDLKTGDAFTLRFAPAVDGREFSAVTVNGKDETAKIAFDKENNSTFTYEGTMGLTGTKLDIAFTTVNKLVLRNVIGIAEELKEGEEYNTAIPAVKSAFNKALEHAQAVNTNRQSTQEEIDNAWTKMIKTIHMLSFAEGDKTELIHLLDTVGLLEEAEYTSTSWSALAEAADAAREVIADENALVADVQAAYDKLYNAEKNLVRVSDKSGLENVIDYAEQINLDDYLDTGDSKAAFTQALEAARAVVDDKGATQKQVDNAAEALVKAIMALRQIPDAEALKDLVAKFETVNPADYTSASYAAYKASISLVKDILAMEAPAQEEINAAFIQAEDCYDHLVKAAPAPKPSTRSSKSAPVVDNTYGKAGIAAVNTARASVQSDTTVNFTLKRGSAYCFKMTVINGDTLVPSFTVGNGDVLKTQFVARIGSDYYYRVWATGAPGQSTGVYTTLTGQNARQHCTVTVI